jgi:HPt (histidine-containing phosphotransfer) domain-containing protein
MVLRWAPATHPAAAAPGVPVPGPASPKPQGTAPESASLDRAALDRLRLVGADGTSLLCKLIGMFLSDTPERLVGLVTAIERGDAAEVRMIAHTLKSSSALLGAGLLSSRFALLEGAAREGASERWPDLLEEVRQEYGRTAPVFESVRAAETANV